MNGKSWLIFGEQPVFMALGIEVYHKKK